MFSQASAMSVDDFGRDLAGIQALQRKQEDVEKDMTALYQQIQVLCLYSIVVLVDFHSLCDAILVYHHLLFPPFSHTSLIFFWQVFVVCTLSSS